MKFLTALSFLFCLSAYASGTFVVPPPMPMEAEETAVDCSVEINKEKEECKDSKEKK